MFGQIELFQITHGLAKHASARQAQIAANIANADTPGFKAQDLKPFNEVYRMSRSDGDGLRITRPKHDLSSFQPGSAELVYEKTSTPASPNGNTVSLEHELVEAARVRQTHDLALTVFQTSLGILRSAVRTTR